MSSQDHPTPLKQTLRSVLSVGNIPLLDIAEILWRVGKRLLPYRPGIYEVLEYDTRLELLDTKGKKAVFYKHQRVKFLQDNIIAYQDQAWGDGDIFADYQCSPGVMVDRYQEGNVYRILISLRETKNAGDTEEFHIKRTIHNGFSTPVEYFQTRIDHQTNQLSMSVVFPKKRPPKRVMIVRQNTSKSIDLGGDHIHILPDGRQKVTWRMKHPKIFEAYNLRWEW